VQTKFAPRINSTQCHSTADVAVLSTAKTTKRFHERLWLCFVRKTWVFAVGNNKREREHTRLGGEMRKEARSFVCSLRDALLCYTQYHLCLCFPTLRLPTFGCIGTGTWITFRMLLSQEFGEQQRQEIHMYLCTNELDITAHSRLVPVEHGIWEKSWNEISLISINYLCMI